VRAAINDLVRETGIATLLTGMMILLFPGSWRSTLIVCVSIPLSILTSLVVLSLCNQTINVMTLFDVYAGNDRRDLGGVANDVYRVVGEVEPKLPPGAFIKVRGQVETMESSFLRLGLGMLFAPRGNCLRKSNRPNWTSRFCRLVPLSPRQKGSSRRPRPISRKRKQRWNSPAYRVLVEHGAISHQEGDQQQTNFRSTSAVVNSVEERLGSAEQPPREGS
jgi:hypothetical protein